MPPEQARGEFDRVDVRSDLFSLAATLFVLATGKVAREAPTSNLQLLAAMTEPFPPVQSVLPALPDAVARLIDRGVMLDPAARFQTAKEMRAAVHDAWTTFTGSPPAALGSTFSLMDEGASPPAAPAESPQVASGHAESADPLLASERAGDVTAHAPIPPEDTAGAERSPTQNVDPDLELPRTRPSARVLTGALALAAALAATLAWTLGAPRGPGAFGLTRADPTSSAVPLISPPFEDLPTASIAPQPAASFSSPSFPRTATAALPPFSLRPSTRPTLAPSAPLQPVKPHATDPLQRRY
jgi:eukaryotic-like serine/threonine-protein kinase